MNMRDYHKINISENDARDIENTYNGLLSSLKRFSGKVDIAATTKGITDIIDIIIKNLSSKENGLLLYISKIFEKDYIFAHSLNVCFISIIIGLRLKFDRERLRDLGFLGLVNASEDMKYPKELLKPKDDKELCEIVRLADVYDALTHPPSYRHSMTPYDMLASMIGAEKFLNRRFIKILLQELTLYPKGTWVQLSNGEKGKVSKINKVVLLRPIVKVFIDWNGRYLKEAKTTDLSKDTTIYISRSLTMEEVDRIGK